MTVRKIVYVLLLVFIVAVLTAQETSGAASSRELKRIRWAVAVKVMSPIVINTVVGDYLGYFAEEGLTLETLTLGSNPAVIAALDKGDTDIGVGVPSFQLPIAAKGDRMPAVNFYEYTYPFKWDWVVKPDSPITDIAQLRGKKVGVSSFGITDYPMGQLVLKMVGIAPQDVQWIAVGEGAPAGVALERGQIDALFHYDTGFGLMEMAGFKFRYLPRPKGLPMVGGLYLSTTREFLNKNRAMAVGMGRATAKATVFCLENAEACAYAFVQMFPEAAPKGQPLPQQVKAIMGVFAKRSKLWAPYGPVKKWGYILETEWWDEVKFADLMGKVTGVRQFFTNELIDEINNFDQDVIRKQARAYKLPYK